MTDLWSRGIPTLNEYSQLVTPQVLYFFQRLLQRDVRGHLNRLDAFWRHGTYSDNFWRALSMVGVRYSAALWPLPAEFNPGLPLAVTVPYRPSKHGGGKPGDWHLYELPNPNVGDYSPTRVVLAATGDEIMTLLSAPDFDFTQMAVLRDAPAGSLVAARTMRFSHTRAGLHVSGHSDGTSLVVLPQQFSNCLRIVRGNARLVRANLMMTGIVFSGALDADIEFAYGILSPSCRKADIADMKTLGLKIDQRMPHLEGDRRLPTWVESVEKLRGALKSLKGPVR
jgi:hypothetical protein